LEGGPVLCAERGEAAEFAEGVDLLGDMGGDGGDGTARYGDEVELETFVVLAHSAIQMFDGVCFPRRGVDGACILISIWV
jgi:hypothetical protein